MSAQPRLHCSGGEGHPCPPARGPDTELLGRAGTQAQSLSGLGKANREGNERTEPGPAQLPGVSVCPEYQDRPEGREESPWETEPSLGTKGIRQSEGVPALKAERLAFTPHTPPGYFFLLVTASGHSFSAGMTLSPAPGFPPQHLPPASLPTSLLPAASRSPPLSHGCFSEKPHLFPRLLHYLGLECSLLLFDGWLLLSF